MGQLDNRRRYGNISGSGESGSGQSSSYDKRVSYLESDGHLYIDTGVIPTANTGIYVRCLSIIRNYNNVDDQYIVGLRNDSGNTRWCIGRSGSADSTASYYYGYGNYAHVQLFYICSKWYNVSLNYVNDGKFTAYDGKERREITLKSLSFTPAYPIRLFGSSGVNASYSKASVKISWVRISENDVVIRDFIPVRIGNVGYLYEKVQGKLYGNIGTGTFTLGPDIND